MTEQAKATTQCHPMCEPQAIAAALHGHHASYHAGAVLRHTVHHGNLGLRRLLVRVAPVAAVAQDQPLHTRHVRVAVEHHTVRGFAVTPSTAGLLVVPFHRLGHGCVDDEPNMSVVDAHAICAEPHTLPGGPIATAVRGWAVHVHAMVATTILMSPRLQLACTRLRWDDDMPAW